MYPTENHIINKYHTVEYLVCRLDSNLSSKYIAIKVNAKVKLLYRQNKY